MRLARREPAARREVGVHDHSHQAALALHEGLVMTAAHRAEPGHADEQGAGQRDAEAARTFAKAAAEAAMGPIDVLVNSAGAAKRVVAGELTPARWRDAMDAKFFTYINVLDPVIKRMGERRKGAVVNVIGAGGKVASTVHLSGGSANAALMLATAGLAAAYAPMGIRVNAVNPASTLTERLKEGIKVAAANDNVSEEQALKDATRKVPLGRLATPEEVADTVAYLASDRASYVTGTIITMDGSQTPLVV